MITADAAHELARDCQRVAYYSDGGYTPVYTLDLERFATAVEQRVVTEIVEYLNNLDTTRPDLTGIYQTLALRMQLLYCTNPDQVLQQKFNEEKIWQHL